MSVSCISLISCGCSEGQDELDVMHDGSEEDEDDNEEEVVMVLESLRRVVS